MKLVDRYISKTVLAAIALITLLLAGLQLFILFVNQLDDLGKADYNIVQASMYVLLQTPYQVYLFFPMASLLGCLIGLGILANNHELIVMRAAGMSIGQITLAVLKAAMIVIVLVTLVGETLVPKLSRMGNDQKMQAMNGGQTLRTAHGVWLRQANDFISIGTIRPGNILDQVYQFRFDKTHHLQLARKMDRIDYEEGRWQAYGVSETLITKDKTVARHLDKMQWDVRIKPTVLSIVGSNEPDEMTLRELHHYLKAQKNTYQSVADYELSYWQRLIQPITTAVMMVLAIPFIFGPLRSSTMGAKLLIGATVGFGFHIINRFFGPVSQVLQWPPEIAALGPTFLFALLGLYLMRRVR